MRPLLIVFAKTPEPGKVKSRLAPALSLEAAAQLHEAMATDLLARLRALDSEFDVELHTDAPTHYWPAAIKRLQSGRDLGARMLTAIQGALGAGRPLVVVMGGDAPTVPMSHLASLAGIPVDVSLGPTTDGGFYAVGCRRTHPAMFEGVTWSSPYTLVETIRAIEASGLSVGLGQEWYDIDVPADLDRLEKDPEIGPATRRVLLTAGLGSEACWSVS